jgi:hypothetical protein
MLHPLFLPGVALLAGLSLLLGGCLGASLAPFEASVRHPATSPSGRYRLVVQAGGDAANGPYQRFEVYPARQPAEKLFAAPEHFRTRDRTYFVWDRADRVWVYSGDVGTFYWERRTATAWEKIAARPDAKLRPPAPIDRCLPWRRSPAKDGG